MITRIVLICLLLSSILGCSNYINSIYSELDQKTGVKRRQNKKDRFAYFKKYQKKSNRINSSRYRYMPPTTKRHYQEREITQKNRHTVNDLYDNTDSTSLWTNLGADNHLFTQDRKKQNGDIIVVNVLSKLKNQITMELKRAFPPIKRKKKKGSASKTPASTPETVKTDSNTTDDKTGDQKVFDHISSVVIDRINKNHLLIRGRKNLIYRGRKRTVEIEALIARRSITTNDTIESNEILESYIEVLR